MSRQKNVTVTFGDVDWAVTGNALRGKRVLRGTCVVSILLVASSRDLFATGTFSYSKLLRRLVGCTGVEASFCSCKEHFSHVNTCRSLIVSKKNVPFNLQVGMCGLQVQC